MKNYYEILEINENASPEIIEKAYKVLAKKYHPDVQPPDKKKWAEEKFKEIGEAYEILSDETKKANYDFELASNSSSSEDLRQQNEFLRRNNESLQNEVSSLRRNMQSNSSEPYTTVSPDNNFYQDELANQNFMSKDEYYADQKAYQDELAKKLYQAQKKAYNDAYIKNLKNMGYKIRYKKTFKTYLKDFLAIILTLLMIFLTGFILWKIPTTHDILLSFYNENPLVRVIVDMIINLFT